MSIDRARNAGGWDAPKIEQPRAGADADPPGRSARYIGETLFTIATDLLATVHRLQSGGYISVTCGIAQPTARNSHRNGIAFAPPAHSSAPWTGSTDAALPTGTTNATQLFPRRTPKMSTEQL